MYKSQSPYKQALKASARGCEGDLGVLEIARTMGCLPRRADRMDGASLGKRLCVLQAAELEE